MKISVFDVTISLVLISTELGLLSPVLSYLKYVPLILAPLFLHIRLKHKILIENQKLRTPFLLLLLVSTLLHLLSLNLIGFINILIWLSVLLLILAIPESARLNYKFINVSLLIPLTLLILFRKEVHFDFSLEALIASETSSIESNMLPFIAGIFAIYWFVKKKWLYFILNCAILLLTFKRIVILSFIAGICVYVFPRLRFLFRPSRMVILNFLYVALTFWIVTDSFDSLVREYAGVSAGFLTKGRTSLLSPIIELIGDSPAVILFGLGQGNAVVLISEHFGFRTLLHNDVLKILIEHGIFVFILFFRMLYKMKSHFSGILIYFNLLLFTDNVLIYSPVLLLLLLILNFENKNDGIELSNN